MSEATEITKFLSNPKCRTSAVWHRRHPKRTCRVCRQNTVWKVSCGCIRPERMDGQHRNPLA